MSYHPIARRTARFESLEQRHLLAGDVVVSVVNGVVNIQGDNVDNHIEITAGAEDGTILITGLDNTTVHLEGQTPAASVTVEASGSARIELGVGNDSVALDEVALRGNLTILMGEGNDNVSLGASNIDGAVLANGLLEEASVGIRGTVRVDTNGGEDTVVVDNAAVRGSLQINTGIGNDMVTLGSAIDAGPAVVGGDVGNAKRIGVSDSNAQLHLRGGASVNLGDGNDVLTVNEVAARIHAFVDAGDGDDQIGVHNSTLGGLTVLGDEGADGVRVSGANIRHLSIFGGDDGDRVEIIDSAFSSLWVALGDGDDALSTTNVGARFAVLLGGMGQDSFNRLGMNDFMFDIVNGFEIPQLIVAKLQPFAGGLARGI